MVIERSCPICGQQHAQILFRPKASPGPISKCLNCNMVYVASIEDDHALTFDGPVTYDLSDSNVLTSSNINDVKDLWEFTLLPSHEAEQPILRMNALNTLKKIETYINTTPKEGKILDFGSGWGFFLAAAKELGWDTYGLEPLVTTSVYARATFGLNIITDTLHKSTYKADLFNVITSFQVFEHVPNPMETIQHFHRILKKGGIVLIEVPNYKTWTMKIMKSRHRHFVQDHINFFSADTLGQLLKDNGFEVTDHYYPTRKMSIGHLINEWLSKYLPIVFTNILQKTLKDTKIWKRMIGVNVRDIVTIIARKS